MKTSSKAKYVELADAWDAFERASLRHAAALEDLQSAILAAQETLATQRRCAAALYTLMLPSINLGRTQTPKGDED